MNEVDTAAARDLGARLAGKYLTFALSSETYGLEILRVTEIIGMMHITRVPRCPDYMNGVINLRGKIIPVVDLRARFKMSRATYNEKTCIIIVSLEMNGVAQSVGMIVDTVLEVVEFDAQSIEPAPKLGAHFESSAVLGLGHSPDKRIVVLLDVAQVLSLADLQNALEPQRHSSGSVAAPTGA